MENLESHEASAKRKRSSATVGELEIDVSLPEPPSKKAKRKSKRAEKKPAASKQEPAEAETSSTSERSGHGVWIGNLPWTATKSDVKAFLEKNGISSDQITRLHMPVPNGDASSSKVKVQNKGFSYVDFASADGVKAAIALSETLMGGRRLLIKDAKSFEGRPDNEKSNGQGKETADNAGNSQIRKEASHPPNKRIFVGNLGFEVEKSDLTELFSPCGTISDIHMATFEDSGKCKGFAWVTFDDVESAKSAVRGWVELSVEDTEELEDDLKDENAKKVGETCQET